MKVLGWKLKRKQRNVLVVSNRQPSQSEIDRTRYEWFLCRGPFWKPEKVVVDSTWGRALLDLEAIKYESVMDSSLVEAAQVALVKAIMARHEVKLAWDTLVKDNELGLMVEHVFDEVWVSPRKQTVLRINEDITGTAPTVSKPPRNPWLALGGKFPHLKESLHQGDPKIKPVRPHLFKELEPIVVVLQKDWREAKESIRSGLLNAHALKQHCVKATEELRERELKPNLENIEKFLGGREAQQELPDATHHDTLKKIIKSEEEAHDHGQKIWTQGFDEPESF